MKRTYTPKRPAGLARLLLRLPVWAYRARLGWMLGRRFVLIEHRGRRSGTLYLTVVEVAAEEMAGQSYVVASGFGPRSDWYQNLLAQPETTIQIGRHRMRAWAIKLSPAQGASVMLGYARRHPFAAARLCRFMGFAVDGSDAGYRAVGESVPFLRLRQFP